MERQWLRLFYVGISNAVLLQFQNQFIKSVIENFNIFDFTLSGDDMAVIASMDIWKSDIIDFHLTQKGTLRPF